MTIAAPPKSISIGGREFQTAGDSAGSPRSGGYNNERLPNGNPKTSRKLQTPTPWALTDQVIEINLANGDLEYLEEKKDNAEDMVIVVEYADAIKSGVGSIEGDLIFDAMTSTASLSFSGDGKFEKQ